MNRNLGYINRAINYFRGKPGHQFVLIFKFNIVVLDDSHDPTTTRQLVDRDDFLGLISKAPKTRWFGQIPLMRGDGVNNVGEYPSIQTAATALRCEHMRMMEESQRYESDPVYALETELQAHDWTAWASDDVGIGNAADQHWKKIEDLRAKVSGDVGDALVEKYRK